MTGPEIRGGCAEPPPRQFHQAVDEFNTGKYYRCHDTLEEIWRDEPRAIRKFFQGILQISVALYHERNGNRKGAVRLIESGMSLLEPFGPACLGIDLQDFLNACARVKEFLETPQNGPLPQNLHPELKSPESSGTPSGPAAS